jgi:hypothetical protein
MKYIIAGFLLIFSTISSAVDVGYKGLYLNNPYLDYKYSQTNGKMFEVKHEDNFFSKIEVKLYSTDDTVREIKLLKTFKDNKEGYSCRDYILNFESKILEKYGSLFSKKNHNNLSSDYRFYSAADFTITLDCLLNEFNIIFKSKKSSDISEFKKIDISL